MPNISDTSPPIPGSPVEITGSWLQGVLRHSFGEIDVQSPLVERVGEGYGLASQIYRARWKSSSQPKSVIVKLWRTGMAGRREVDFYRTFAEPIKAWIPACYFAGIDTEKERGLLVLQDLFPAVQGDYLQEMPSSIALAAAAGLAGIHAAWYENEKITKAEWLPPVSAWVREEEWFASRRKIFIERFGDRLNDIERTLLDKIEYAQTAANDRLYNAPVTLLHEDLHLDNYVFYTGEKPVLLDWARCARGPLALDLYELLFNMCQAADRERVFEAYLVSFKKYSGFDLDGDETWYQVGGAFLRKFAAATCGVANWQPNSEREEKIIDKGLERAQSSLSFWMRREPNLFDDLGV
jgi:hypothetical protein